MGRYNSFSLMAGPELARRFFSKQLTGLVLSVPILLGGWKVASGQTVFLDFNTAGQYTNNFNPWNDATGVNGGNYSFSESPTGGAGGSGEVSVFQSSDTTAAYQSGSWDFSTNGATVIISVLMKANGQTSGNKVQLGLMNVNNNGLNNNAGVAFESYRFVPTAATTWSLREQFRTANTNAVEATLGTLTVSAGEWYKFVVALTNTGPGSFNAGCAVYDYGADGQTPGANLVLISTLVSRTGQDIASTTTTWPALRAFQNGGIDAWDNFLVYTPGSKTSFTVPLTNTTVAVNHNASFRAVADGPGTISYAWYTNGILVNGASGSTYTTTTVSFGYTNVMVIATNPNGAATNQATVTVVQPSVAQVANLPASAIQTLTATLNGQVLATGGDTPTVTIFYGPADGMSNPGAWAQSVGLGLQSGAFAQNVTGLSPNTTYYYAARAVNAAGTTWGAPSASFTTAASNPAVTLTPVLTQHNDNARTGANLAETELNVNDVNTNQFGLVFTRAVDDQIYAQPLVMTNVNIPGKGVHNIVYVATVNDSIYAFDAEDASATTAYWTDSFINPPNIVAPRNTDMTGACGGNYKDFSGNMGIVGAPVIDPAAGTLYVVVRTKEISGLVTNYVQRLHALDITTGNERPNSPVVIAAVNAVAFDPYKQNQRPALLLANGYVYITWSSHCDWQPYHGWVMGYNTSNLLLPPITYNATPSGNQAGIWMSNHGPAADSNGNVYLSTGNGTFDGVSNFGEAFLKLTNDSGTLSLASWFAPYNWNNLNGSDQDLGTGGVLLIPGTSLMLSGGKAGVLYVVNRDNMGGLSGSTTADTNIIQSWSIGSHPIHCGPVWWSGPNGAFAYVWGAASDHLRQYQFTNNAKFNTTVFSQSRTVGGSGQAGGILSLSANGTNAGTGILWASVNTTSDANQAVTAGTLHAYNAQNVTNELWNSDMVPGRDALGNYPKFVAPTVANGKVYMATFSNRLNVYGLLPAPPLTIALSGGNVALTWPTNTFLNYALQGSPNLAPGNWLNVTNGFTVSNGVFQVTIPAKGAATFYRLKR
ncbi:MAG TPA: hypothetical protein VN578_17165 [Candidatus Binatia bacterium]|jgi:hypothetical protein|nr:hypothetical protein [Candidatus Binatia bacterium]